MVNEKISIRRQEFYKHLCLVSCKRGICSAILIAIILPILCAVYRATNMGMSGNTILTLVIATSVFEAVCTPVLVYFVARNNQDVIKMASRVYHMVTLFLLLVISIMEAYATGNLLLFAATLGYYVYTPVFNKFEEQVVNIALFVFSIVACVLESSLGDVKIVVETALTFVVFSVAGNYTHSVFRNREKLKVDLKEKTVFSEQDMLTGLNNRRGLQRKTNIIWPHCMRSHTPVGMIELDIDYFKKYNDKFGHPAGDECLKSVAGAIKSCARRGTDIVARTGGEEFLVFVENMTEEELVSFALKIREKILSLKIPHAYAGVSPYVTASMGIAVMYPDGINDMQELYEEVDQALYTAKENGRNCVVCGDRVYGRMKNGLGTVIV